MLKRHDMGNTEGIYTTRCDGVTYVYSASWTVAAKALLWNGTVRERNGTLTGRLGGQVKNARNQRLDLERLVCREMESAIERYAGQA